jgi:LPS export ABC transporter protein LptC
METDWRRRDVGIQVWWMGPALLLVLVVGSGCEHRSRSEANRVPPDSLRRDGPSQVTREAQFVLNEGGRRRAVIRADRMEQYRTDDSTYSVWRTLNDSVRVRSFVFEEGDSSATITADSVVFFNQEGRYEAYGNVVVVTTEGRRLESEHLTWDQSDRKIRTRRFVRIITPTEVVRGNGLVAEEDLETYQIGRFTAEVEVDEEEEEEEEDDGP